MKVKREYQIYSGIEKATKLTELVKPLNEVYFKGDIVHIKIEIEIRNEDIIERIHEIDKYNKKLLK